MELIFIAIPLNGTISDRYALGLHADLPYFQASFDGKLWELRVINECSSIAGDNGCDNI